MSTRFYKEEVGFEPNGLTKMGMNTNTLTSMNCIINHELKYYVDTIWTWFFY